MQNRLGAVFSCLIVICLAAAGQSAPSPKPAVTDADEVRIGQSLAEKMIALEGMQSTPQTVKIEKYLQAVTDKVAANAERKLPYRVHYDPDPGFKSAF
ncbi:MAG: hypothetical protein ACXVZI_13230, partial [Terriglobales bacterium]